MKNVKCFKARKRVLMPFLLFVVNLKSHSIVVSRW